MRIFLFDIKGVVGIFSEMQGFCENFSFRYRKVPENFSF